MRPPTQRDTHVYRDMSAEEEIVEEVPVPEPTDTYETEPGVIAGPKVYSEVLEESSIKGLMESSDPGDGPSPMEDPVDDNVVASFPEPEPEPEPELTMKNTKAEMLSVAEAMDLDVTEEMTKKQILAAIDNA